MKNNRLSLDPFSVRLLAIALPAVLFSACGISGSGIIEEETTRMESFDSIEVSHGFEASIVEGDDYSVTVWADDNLIEDVTVERTGNTVSVDLERDSILNATLEVEFTMPMLAEVELHDGSELDVSEIPLDEDLRIELSDGSRLRLVAGEDVLDFLSVDSSDGSNCSIDALIAGGVVTAADGSHVELDGQADRMALELTDGSQFSGRGLVTDRLTFRLSDGAAAEVNVKGAAAGSLEDGSSLNVWGGGEVDARKSDGSQVKYR